jgi:hypothetical protein
VHREMDTTFFYSGFFSLTKKIIIKCSIRMVPYLNHS